MLQRKKITEEEFAKQFEERKIVETSRVILNELILYREGHHNHTRDRVTSHLNSLLTDKLKNSHTLRGIDTFSQYKDLNYNDYMELEPRLYVLVRDNIISWSEF